MKNLKGVFLYLGMGSCVSTKSSEKLPPTNSSTTTTTTMEKAVINPAQPSIWQVAGSKEEQFFDSKAWLESDDEDFLSVNGDYSPPSKHVNGNDDDGDHQGRRLSDLFKNSSFTSDSQTSLKAAEVAASTRKNQNLAKNDKLEKEKSMKRCIPSLVRSLSWRDRKRRPSHAAVAVAVAG